MPQTTPPAFDLEPGLPGMEATAASGNVVSRVNTESSAEIPLGVFVIRDNSAQPTSSKAIGVKLPSASTDATILEGIVTRSQHYGTTAIGTTGLKPGVMMGVETNGCRWMRTEQAVTRGDDVYVRFSANGGNTQKGSVRKDADNPGSGATAFLVKGATFESDAGAGKLVKVRFSALANRAAHHA